MKFTNQKKVLIAIDMSDPSFRKQASGILRFIGSQANWDIRLIQSAAELTVKRVSSEIKDGVDGFLLGMKCERKCCQLIASTNLPLVTIDLFQPDFAIRKTNFIDIRVDNHGVGRNAAHHLLGLGKIESYAFIPYSGNPLWSSDRMESFIRELENNRKHCLIFKGDDDDTPSERHSLVKFLQALPKPAALFCANDERAAQTLQLCQSEIIQSRIFLLGADNNEFFCDYTHPKISSVNVNFTKQGYVAARELDALLTARRPKPAFTLLTRAEDVIIRETTSKLDPGENIFRRAQEFIAENALGDLSANDIAAYLKISRRLLDLRYAKHGHTTVAKEIESRRLKEVRHLLKNTNLRTPEIARRCGFKNHDSLRNLFRLRHGMTMREFRNRPRCASLPCESPARQSK